MNSKTIPWILLVIALMICTVLGTMLLYDNSSAENQPYSTADTDYYRSSDKKTVNWHEMTYTISDTWKGTITLPDGKPLEYSGTVNEFLNMSGVSLSLFNAADYDIKVTWEATAVNLDNRYGSINIAGNTQKAIKFTVVKLGEFHVSSIKLTITKQ